MGASRLVVCRQPQEGGRQEDDSALVAAVQAGDVSAFAELFRRHHLAVKQVCARRLGEVEADEVAQAAFVRAFERIDQCLGDRRFGAWVQVIARRLCLDLLRARIRTVPDDDPLRDDRLALNVVIDLDAGTVTEEALVRRERTERVQEALAQLPDRQRAVLVARHFEDRRPQEIAAALGLSVGAVDSLLLRARRRLALNCQHVLADSAATAPAAPAATGAGVASAALPGHIPALPDMADLAHRVAAVLPAIQSDVHIPLRRLAVAVAAAAAPILVSAPLPLPRAAVSRPAPALTLVRAPVAGSPSTSPPTQASSPSPSATGIDPPPVRAGPSDRPAAPVTAAAGQATGLLHAPPVAAAQRAAAAASAAVRSSKGPAAGPPTGHAAPLGALPAVQPSSAAPPAAAAAPAAGGSNGAAPVGYPPPITSVGSSAVRALPPAHAVAAAPPPAPAGPPVATVAAAAVAPAEVLASPRTG